MSARKINQLTWLYCVSLFFYIVAGELTRLSVVTNQHMGMLGIHCLQMISYVLLIFIISQHDSSLRRRILLFSIVGVLGLGYVVSHKSAYFIGALFIIAAERVPWRQIIKTCLVGILSMFCVTIFFYILGYAPDLKNYEGKYPVSFGYGNPNLAAEHIVLIVLLAIILTEYFQIERKRAWHILLCVVAVILCIYLKSKTAIISLAVTASLMPVLKCVTLRDIGKKRLDRLLHLIMMIFMPIMVIFDYVTALMFSSNKLVQKLDSLLTNRIFLNSFAFKYFPIKLFGNDVDLHVKHVHNAVRNTWNITTTVDCSYTLSLLILGLIPSIIVLMAYAFMINKVWKNRDYMILMASIVLCFYAYMESQFLQVYYFFPFLYMMAEPVTINKNIITGKNQ